MSKLPEALEDYLAVRRSLGFKLRGIDSGLRAFVAFMECERAAFVTVDLALRWAKQSTTTQPRTWASRLQMVRGFARWRAAMDPRTEVPPMGLLPSHYPRKPPYIYTDGEVAKLVRAASELPGLRGRTYFTLFGLLSVTGMRISEALALDREEVDLDEGILSVSQTKCSKSRLVPVHESTREVLAHYAKERNRIVPEPKTPGFFVSERGSRVTQWATRDTFIKVACEIGLRRLEKGQRYGHGPRIHDLRHRFAVRTLLDWYRAGLDVEREMPKLATYLGHSHIKDTYWYLEAVPELLELASRRIQNNKRGDK